MPKPRNIVLLGASFGTNNMGVNALACGTTASVSSSLPEADLVFMDYALEPGEHRVRSSGGDRSVPLVNIRFSKKFYLRNNIARLLLAALLWRLLPVPFVRIALVRAHPAMGRLLEADFVAALSGGDSFSDIYGIPRLLYVGLPQILTILLGKPLVLLPQTVGPFARPACTRIARYILRRSKRTFCRDHESLAEVKRIVGGDAPNASFAYDMGFALEPLPPEALLVERLNEIRTKGPLVGFNVSGLLYAGGYTGKNEFGLRDDYRALVDRMLEELMTLEGVQVLLVPHVYGGAESKESDLTACDEVFRKHEKRWDGRLHYFPRALDQHEVKHLIGRCDFFMGSRMHACIAALSQCVPAVGLAYSRKFDGVYRTIKEEGLVVDLRKESRDGVTARVKELCQERAAIRDRLEGVIPDVKNSVLGLFREIESTCCGQ